MYGSSHPYNLRSIGPGTPAPISSVAGQLPANMRRASDGRDVRSNLEIKGALRLFTLKLHAIDGPTVIRHREQLRHCQPTRTLAHTGHCCMEAATSVPTVAVVIINIWKVTAAYSAGLARKAVPVSILLL